MPTVRILSTGGTIASTGDSGDDLVAIVPELADYASLEVAEVCQLPGFQMGETNATCR
ncbi:L-asparaginase [Natronobacterium gregoryi]|uniref:Asparaginase/glutaminase n=2 Tax=Natronobacterium gregoryi TaxID=44930 RepID=L9Y5P6_NATGS|nr:asparaginase/glutaminase [Natronobacterium gregoryi SP2]SFI91202.1 L-asparaginase [Natronobacterium gregoryi]